MMGLSAILAFGKTALGNPFVRYGLIIAAALLALHLWGNSRYNADVDDTDAKWVEAGEMLKDQAEDAALAATAEKEIRDSEFADEQTTIQKEVDNAKTDDLVGSGVAKYFDQLKKIKGE